jgi:hypothetical protein
MANGTPAVLPPLNVTVATLEQRQGFELESLNNGGSVIEGTWHITNGRVSKTRKNLISTLRRSDEPKNPNRLDVFLDVKFATEVDKDTGVVTLNPYMLFKKGYSFTSPTIACLAVREDDNGPFESVPPALVLDPTDKTRELVYWSCYMLDWVSEDFTGSPTVAAGEKLIARLPQG